MGEKLNKQIGGRIAKHETEITLQQLAKELVQPNGRTFSPARYFPDETGTRRRTSNQWAGQQIYGIDIDKGITFEEAIQRCKEYEVEPFLAYSTFSSINNNKFRLLFCLPFEVTNLRVRNTVQLALQVLFPEADSSCKDPARMFFGGREIIYQKYDARIDIEGAIKGMCFFIETRYLKHTAKKIRDFCVELNLFMINGRPLLIQERCFLSHSLGENSAHPIIYYYRSGGEISEKCMTLLDTDRGEIRGLAFYEDSIIEEQATEHPQSNMHNIKVNRKYTRRYDWEKLRDNCKLYREFIGGKSHIDHDVRFGIACNMLMIEGGQEKFRQAINLRNEYDHQKWELECDYIIRQDYKPARCKKYCKYAAKCNHAENMLQQGKLPRGSIQVISKPPVIPIEEAEKRLRIALEHAVAASDNKIYVIKGPTGIGKTELYLPLQNALIAVPTHRLAQEILIRANDAGNPVIRTPQLPEMEESTFARLNYYYSIGAYSSANQLLHSMAKEGADGIKEYIDEIEQAKRSDKTVITTHERALYLENNKNLLLVDEDILPTLLKIGAVRYIDLQVLCLNSVRESYGKSIDALLSFVTSQPNNIITPMPQIEGIDSNKLEKLIVTKSNVSSNVLGFLKCSHFVKHSVNNYTVIHFIIKRDLPMDKKVIILSATANEKIYKMLYGDRVEFIDIGQVETKGRIVQYASKSYSRYQIEHNSDLIKSAKAVIGDTPVITFKAYTDEFGENAICTFGATAGIDEYTGRDIAVVGTPHIAPVVYGLYAATLGVAASLLDYQTMGYNMIERNGYRFRFNTYSDNPSLQEIQLHLIESELLQAVGRARILRNDCTVTVFSNYPIPGADITDMEQNLKEVS